MARAIFETDEIAFAFSSVKFVKMNDGLAEVVLSGGDTINLMDAAVTQQFLNFWDAYVVSKEQGLGFVDRATITRKMIADAIAQEQCEDNCQQEGGCQCQTETEPEKEPEE